MTADWVLVLNESVSPLVDIRQSYEQLAVGSTLLIRVNNYHVLGKQLGSTVYFLMDETLPPIAFSLKHTVEQALNTICPMAPANLEELPEHVQHSLAAESEGQGLWKWVSLEEQEAELVAVVKKI